MRSIKILITIIISIQSLNAQLIKTDSILAAQNSTLQQICREIKNVGTEVSKIDSSKFRKVNLVGNSKDTTYLEINPEINTSIKEANKKSLGDMLYSSFGHLMSALIAAIIAICIFFKRWKKEKKKEEKNKLQEIEEKNQYFKSILIATIGLSEKYKKSIDDFTEEIDANPYEIPDIKLYPLQEFQRLQRIVNNEQYFHAYLNKYGNTEKTINNYRTISSLSDYLASQISELQKKDYKIRDYNRKVDYLDIFQQILEETSELGKSNETKDRSIFIAFDKILKGYLPHIANGFVTDLSVGQINFIEPLKEEILNNHFEKEEVRILLNKIAKASRIYNEIPFQNRGTLKQFRDFQEILDEVLQRMKEESKHIVEPATNT